MNPASQFQVNILMAVAQFERSLILDRVFAGLKAAKANGVKLGRPTTLDKHQEEVRQLLADGLGVRAIARRLQLPLGSAHKLVKAIRAAA